jgi:hypothetical protein
MGEKSMKTQVGDISLNDGLIYPNEPTSTNKLILEAYIHTDMKAEIRSGWASVSQKNSLKGLKLLVQSITNGVVYPAGSTAYIKEELLHSQPWAKNKLKSDTLSGEFIIVTMNEVEYIAPPTGNAA